MFLFAVPFLNLLVIFNTILSLVSPSSLDELFAVDLRDIFAVKDIHVSHIHIPRH